MSKSGQQASKADVGGQRSASPKDAATPPKNPAAKRSARTQAKLLRRRIRLAVKVERLLNFWRSGPNLNIALQKLRTADILLCGDVYCGFQTFGFESEAGGPLVEVRMAARLPIRREAKPDDKVTAARAVDAEKQASG